MKIFTCPQGSDEWRLRRLGIPTASQFDRLITAKKGDPSTGWRRYLAELISEWETGVSADDFESDWMVRGSELEGEAFAWYEMERGVDLQLAGLVMRDDELVACSPDRLVGTELVAEMQSYNGVEGKAPMPKTHTFYELFPEEIQDAYRQQVQGSIWLCKSDWWDTMSYHPLQGGMVIRCYRDDAYIAKLAQIVDDFIGKLLETRNMLIDRGRGPREEVAA